MYQSEVLRQRSDTRDELGFERRWCQWRCWWRLTPSQWEDRWWWRWWRFPPPGGMFPRQNSSARTLDWFCRGSASRRRRFIPKASFWFFLGQNTPYNQRWAPEACQGAHKVGGRALHPYGWLVAPFVAFSQYFLLIPKITFVEFQDFWSCAE